MSRPTQEQKYKSVERTKKIAAEHNKAKGRTADAMNKKIADLAKLKEKKGEW